MGIVLLGILSRYGREGHFEERIRRERGILAKVKDSEIVIVVMLVTMINCLT